jgi:DNA repair protein RAD57
MSFSHFKNLGSDIWLYEPLDCGGGDGNIKAARGIRRTRGRGDPPALIILCTWLGGATTKRIEKYTQGYHHLWPCSRILLIRTTLSEYLVQNTTSLRKRLRPANREIRRISLETQGQDKPTGEPENGEVLLHMFSLGGSNTATQLLESINAILATMGHQGPLPLRQIILDSCPGDLDICRSHRAGAHSLPNGILLKPLGSAALFVLAVTLAGLEATGLRTPLAKRVREQLNDPEIFSARAARLYLASEADDIVDFRDVEAHRNQAIAKGFEADILLFQRAGHCSLIMENGTAYWNAIASRWERSAASSTAQRSRNGQDTGSLPLSSLSMAISSATRSRL